MSDRAANGDGALRVRTWVTVATLLVLGVLLAFIVIPLVQGSAVGIDSFTAICRAFGILPGSPARATPVAHAAPQPVTQVAWTIATLAEIEHADPRHGAEVAQERCVACHSPDGSSAAPTIPRMAGQSFFAIYKQLHDFRSGARVSEIMSVQVKGLDDKSIADVAAYFGHLLRGSSDLPNPSFVPVEIENIVVNGDVARGLPPCIACHGAGSGGPIEVPTLTSQHQDYLQVQLQAFANGQRHNDIYHRMRDVASRLTPREMELLAIYYAGLSR
jgi:cytochrome c553